MGSLQGIPCFPVIKGLQPPFPPENQFCLPTLVLHVTALTPVELRLRMESPPRFNPCSQDLVAFQAFPGLHAPARGVTAVAVLHPFQISVGAGQRPRRKLRQKHQKGHHGPYPV